MQSMGSFVSVVAFQLAAAVGAEAAVDMSASRPVPMVQVTQNIARVAIEAGTDIRFVRLSRTQGLSQQRVTHIVQDTQGFMWFGTQYGLDRYDGYRFRVFKRDPANPGSLCGVIVFALFKDSAGRLWVGCDYSLDRLDPETETFVHYRIDPAIALDSASTIRDISEDKSGHLWLSTGNGLYRLDPPSGHATRFRHDTNDPRSLSTDNVKSSGEDRTGQFWVATGEGLDAFDRDTGHVTLHVPLQEPRELSFYEDRSGVFWVFYSSGNGLAILDRKEGTLSRVSFAEHELPGLPLTGVSSMLEDKDGTLWIGTFSDGLLKLDRHRWRFVRYRHDPSNNESIAEDRVTTLFEDREGSLWAGLGATEPAFFVTRPPPFTKLPFDSKNQANLGEALVNAVYEDPQRILWTGTTGALNRFESATGRYTHFDIPGGGVASDVLCIVRDRSGSLWVGTSGHGLYRLNEGSGHLEAFRHSTTDASSLSNDSVARLFVDHAGNLWAATLDGLNRFNPATRRFAVFRPQGTSRASPFISIAEDKNGILWLGSYGEGLLRFDPITGRFDAISRAGAGDAALSDDRVNSVHIDRDGGIWAGTQNGLNRLDPSTKKVTAYFEKDGLSSNAVSCILEDDRGDLWIGTSNGLSQLDRSRKRFRTYSLADGLPGPDLTGWGACFRSVTGEMFFGGFSGGVAFFPRDMRDSAYTPPVVLTAFELFGAPVALGPKSPLQRAIGYTDELTLSHLESSFSFEFSALSFRSAATNRYRYKLEGLDSSWHEVGSYQRFVSYTTLPSGAYAFMVQGATSRGPWSDPGVTLRLTIRPPWWETWWFRAIIAACVLMIMLAAYLYRVRQLSRQFDIRLEATVDERTRIARELHDSLLQGFQGTMYLLQAVRNMLPHQAAGAAVALETALDRGDQAIAEGRGAVQGLRSSMGVGGDLGEALNALGAEFESSPGAGLPSYRVIVQGKPRTVAAVARDEIYRIAREAFRNAVRHSRANKIEAELDYGDVALRLRVRDDGIGIGRDVLSEGKRAGHWGLPGMRERAEGLKGRLAVWSESGAGTEIEITIPASVAYAPSL